MTKHSGKIEWIYGQDGRIVGAIVDGQWFYNMPEVWANEKLHAAYHKKIGEDNGRESNSETS